MRGWVGIDAGLRSFNVSVLDATGTEILAKKMPMSATVGADLVGLLRPYAGRRKYLLPIALEDPNALLCEALQRAGFRVVAVHCLALARYREGTASAKSKSDVGDARLLADIMRVQPLRHRDVPRSSEHLAALRVQTRAYGDHARRLRRLQRQMWSMLDKYYPAANNAPFRWGGLLGRDARVALRLAPTPRHARSLRATVLADALRTAGRHHTVRRASEEIVAALRQGDIRLRPAVEEEYGAALLDLLDIADAVVGMRERCRVRALEHAAAHSYWPIYQSFPALGQITGASVMAEIGDDLTRFGSNRALLAVAGVSPVTHASGTREAVHLRHAYNRRLGAAVNAWGLPLIGNSAAAKHIYDRHRSAGDTYQPAIRRVLNRFLRSLYACLRDGRLFDEHLLLPDPVVPAQSIEEPDGATDVAAVVE